MNNYKDPILQLIADLRIVYDNASNELVSLREMLNEQNTNMMVMKQEIDRLNIEKTSLESRIMDMSEGLLKDSKIAFGRK